MLAKVNGELSSVKTHHAEGILFNGWMRYVARRKSFGIRKLQTKNSIKNQIVQKMDPVEYCMNLSKSMNWLNTQAKNAIKRHHSADENLLKGSGKPPIVLL